MIIDGHAHLGGEYKDLPTTLLTMDSLGIDHVILCPSDADRPDSMPLPGPASGFPGMEMNFLVNRLIRRVTQGEKLQKFIDQGNENVYNISRMSAGRIIQFFWANPLKRGILDELDKKIAGWKFRGIKLHQSCHPFKIISPQFRDLVDLAASENIPVFIHLHSKKDIPDLIRISSTIKTPFIVGHLIGLELFIRSKAKVSDNIYFDVSCPALVSAERIKKAIKEFGPERIVMGSDTPYGADNARKVISRIKSLNLKDSECEMILGKNLKAIINF